MDMTTSPPPPQTGPPPPSTSFKLGDAFPTFADVKERIDIYSSENHFMMSISDCRTLKSAVSTKRTAKEISEEKANLLHYSEVKYSCICYGESG